MDKETRNAIERATQKARRLLEEEFEKQLVGAFDVLLDGKVAPRGGDHLSPRQHAVRERIVASVAHRRAAGEKPAEAVASYVRDAAFTTLNRFVALRMLEARGLLKECVSRGEQSSGYGEFHGLAPGLKGLPDGTGYRLYLESLFDELSTEVKVLFDRRDPASALWPRKGAFDDLLAVLNAPELSAVWGEDETIGWVYQYFNSGEERRAMRDASQAPRNSRELAVRNQFFTPRYVVRFLTENTLARIWIEMMGGPDGASRIADRCEFLVRDAESRGPRAKKDPRDLKLLDPACGSGHFLLYAFDLLLVIYEEAWADPEAAPFTATGRTLQLDYPDLESLRKAAPLLVLEHNLHGVDIDPRCAQIAALALWLRAQRAWKEAGFPASARPRITRTHIVVAEPMPGDEALVEEFAATLNPPLLGGLFRKMVAEMRLAGELGTLLKIETLLGDEIRKANAEFNRQKKATGYLPGFEPPTQGQFDFSQIDDDAFFDRAEELLLAALRRFADATADADGMRKRLFSGDAAQGIALIELLRSQFDAVLANPPFGEPVAQTRGRLASDYEEARNDVYAAFLVRSASFVERSNGYAGVITSRSYVTGRDHRLLRKRLLARERPGLMVLLDLGAGVLDSALVETAAVILGRVPAQAPLVFIDARGVDKGIVSGFNEGPMHRHERERFLALKGCDFLYDLPEAALTELAGATNTIEPSVGRVTFGLTTKDNARFIRLRWEVDPVKIARRYWVRLSKGGDYSWFSAGTHLVVKQVANGAELAAFAESCDGNVASTRRSSTFFFRPGISFSRRSQKGFSARRLRPSECFTDNNGVIIPDAGHADWLLALPFALASREYETYIEAHSKFGSYEIGPVKSLPVPDRALLAQRDTWRAVYEFFDVRETSDETSELFIGPYSSASHRFPEGMDVAEVIGKALAKAGMVLSEAVAEWLDELSSCAGSKDAAEEALLHYSVGVSFGRFDVRFVTGEKAAPALPDPFDGLPELAPGILTDEAGAPAKWPPIGYPVKFPEDGVLVDDAGHVRDIVNAVESTARLVVAAKRGRSLDADDDMLFSRRGGIRSWIARNLFDEHLARYSRSRRSAPLYWQLSVPSCAYSLWFYSYRLTADSFFHVLETFVSPKLALEERRLVVLMREGAENPSGTERKRIAAQEAFVDELRAFRDEVARVAPLWRPDLDDGVLLTMAPLWRLVPQHRAWQKELKTAWDSLCEGEYDWAHVAMHLWPERVVPKCSKDRSLAIAHDLQEVFWEEDAKGKWVARPKPLHPIEELIRERTSSAVKAALKDLLEAPVAGSPAKGAGRGKRRAG